MKSILITGGTGFLGQHLIRRLRRVQGTHTLRVLSRGASRWDQDSEVEVVRGDVTSPEDVLRAAEGAQEIYHLAGMVAREPKDAWRLYQTHIEGTRNICEAARRFQAEKVVVVSSSGTFAVSQAPHAHSEDAGYKHELVGEWPYYLSKIFTEKLALGYAERLQLPVVVVNPSLLLGPGDKRDSSTRDVALFLEGQILAVPNGGVNFLDVRDAAAGLVAAMRNAKPGERYLLGGPNWTFRRLIETVAKISGVRAPKLQLSRGVSLWSARILRRLFPLVGKSFQLEDASIKMSSLFWYCDPHKARATLGFETRDPIETLKATVEDVRRRQENN